jgi:2-octaprenyl-6-methoxyphenol hydroxylase
MQHPILIIGGGLVGSAMALALAKAGLSVALVEAKTRKDQLAPAFDGRTSAIAAGSLKVLESIDVWQALDDTCPITDIRVCESGGAHYVHYDHHEAGGVPFGHIVENRLLREALYNAVDAQNNITIYEPDSLKSYEITFKGVAATLTSGKTLKTPLILMADGKFSKSRALAGIEPRITEYGQTAIVASIRHSEPHNGLALENFMPAGPFAVLPMTGKRSNIVWSESHAMAAHMVSLPDTEFAAEIQKRAGDYLGEIELIGPRHTYPLMLIQAEAQIAERVALIGDAGHGIHPIAGQGVNLGYRDVAVLAEMLADQARLGLDVGDPALLTRYAKRRKSDVGSMSMATDALNRLFSNNNPALHIARDLGLGAVERMPRLKGFFMRHAMGMGGETPKMMRGEAI